ncbi:class F sortase [Aeromicrobium sp.]|uniref:class F sortase n=1 Tax=Aeromicrobium sp. TaxID=1871063 RepID=UPI003513549D
MPERFRVVAAVLLVALLSGCGGQDAAPEEPRSTPSASATAAAPTSPATERVAAPPRRVTIPSLGLDEELIGLGIDDASGELEVPEDPARVGWFTGGGKPGESWPVVIAGHKDSRTGPAVFARLTELQVGQQVSVVDTRNQRRTYEITEVRDVPQDGRFPTDDVYGETGDSQLRLITCTGPYDRGIGRYTENRVVFAEEV